MFRVPEGPGETWGQSGLRQVSNRTPETWDTYVIWPALEHGPPERRLSLVADLAAQLMAFL